MDRTTDSTISTIHIDALGRVTAAVAARPRHARFATPVSRTARRRTTAELSPLRVSLQALSTLSHPA